MPAALGWQPFHALPHPHSPTLTLPCPSLAPRASWRGVFLASAPSLASPPLCQEQGRGFVLSPPPPPSRQEQLRGVFFLVPPPSVSPPSCQEQGRGFILSPPPPSHQEQGRGFILLPLPPLVAAPSLVPRVVVLFNLCFNLMVCVP